MSDIFISYARNDQRVARKLADVLERRGWSVWWDPKLRAGEHFDDVIEQALDEAGCVIVLWSKRSVQSRWVKDEAAYALELKKLVPVAIDEVSLPFRYKGMHTPRLSGWDGAEDAPEFTGLVDDIAAIVGRPSEPKPVTHKAEAKREVEGVQRTPVKQQRLERRGWPTRAALIGIIAVIGVIIVVMLLEKYKSDLLLYFTVGYFSQYYDDQLQDRWHELEGRLRKEFDDNDYFSEHPSEWDNKFLELLGVDSEGNVDIQNTSEQKSKDKKTIDDLAKFSRRVLRCLEQERCSEEYVRDHFENPICSLRIYAYGYLYAVSNKEEWAPKYGDLLNDRYKKWCYREKEIYPGQDL